MNNKIGLFAYNKIDTPIHRLSGLTKLICFLLLTFGVMYSYDIRVVLSVMAFALVVFVTAKIRFSQIRSMVYYVLVFVTVNNIISFFFSPEQGVLLYGTRHNITPLYAGLMLTQEQLFYQITLFFKYISVIPFGILFLLTTNPSEFASALNRVGVHYKAAFAVALTLRYFPEIQREYVDISQAQQARGLEMSSKAGAISRLRNSVLIIIPLIFSSLDRIELVSNAMDLRGFGKSPTRTWYTNPRMARGDALALVLSTLIFLATVAVSVFINHSRFYNPFL